MLKNKMMELTKIIKEMEKKENRIIEAYEIYALMNNVKEINETSEEIYESIYEDIIYNLGYSEKRHFTYVDYE